MTVCLVDEAHELVGMKMVQKLIRHVEAMCRDVGCKFFELLRVKLLCCWKVNVKSQACDCSDRKAELYRSK